MFIMNKNVKLLFIVLLVLTVSIIIGCQDDPKSIDPNNENIDTTSFKDQDVVKKVEKVFYTLPSPFEMSQMLKRAGASYIVDILNPPQNVHKYNTERSKALNLGVYGADLSYASIYDQTQETMLFLSSSQELSDGLGISSAFKKNLIDRVEANIDNRDSLLQIISDSFYDTDEFLKQNERPSTAVLILVGGWIEGLYIATQLAIITKNNEEVIQRIADQKYSLENVFGLIEVYKDNSNIKDLYQDMMELKAIYENVELVKAESPIVESTDKSNQTTTIGAASKLEMTEEQLEKITTVVTNIRTKIVE